MPEKTRIDRSRNSDVARLSTTLTRPGWLLRLWGPSKSGKTVLSKQIMSAAKANPISLHGVDIDNIERFWLEIAFNAGGALANIGNPISAHDESRIRAYCDTSQRPLIIDDFHRIPSITQKAILKRLKRFIDSHITVILISVADVAGQIISADNDLQNDFHQRTEPLKAPLWTQEDLSKIASEGFSALGMQIAPEIVKTLTHHAFRNPLLMQQYCEELCRALDIHESIFPSSKKFGVTATMLRQIFERVAGRDARKYERIWSDGGRQHFSLRSQHRANLLTLVLLGISHIAIVSPVRPLIARKEIRELLSPQEALPSLEEVTAASEELVERAKKVLGKELSVDLIQGRLYILHPFFKIYLLWILMPKFTNEFPDIERYVEKEIPESDARV